MKTTTSSCCGGVTTSCDTNIAELPRYYPRQLITPDDLTLEQNYFRDRMRRHNRLLHGWGVVCGALVCPVTTKDSNGVVSLAPWQVQVQTGYILGPYGDEIVVDCARTVDLRGRGVSGISGEPCIDVPDPWCSQVTVAQPPATLYVAIKYKQSMTRPVRVQPIGCGCDDTACECSRWHDGYEIGVLTCCPTAGDVAPKSGELVKLISGDVPTCPDCPPQPWVGLAAVQLESDGSIASIDNCACRRMVASLSRFWWQCSQGDTSVTSVDADKGGVVAGQSNNITVKGKNLPQHATYTFGNGISVTIKNASSSLVDLSVKPDTNITGSRTLIVISSEDCRTVTFPDAITVTAPAQTLAPSGTGQPIARTSPAKKSVIKKTPTPPVTPPTPPVQP